MLHLHGLKTLRCWLLGHTWVRDKETSVQRNPPNGPWEPVYWCSTCTQTEDFAIKSLRNTKKGS